MEYSNLINNSPRFLELCPEGWRREVVFETRERGRGHSRVTVVSLFTEAARKGAHPWLISGYRYRIIAALSKDEFWWTFAPNISTPTPPQDPVTVFLWRESNFNPVCRARATRGCLITWSRLYPLSTTDGAGESELFINAEGRRE